MLHQELDESFHVECIYHEFIERPPDGDAQNRSSDQNDTKN